MRRIRQRDARRNKRSNTGSLLPFRRKVRFESLEPRVLLSGDPLASLTAGNLVVDLTSGNDIVVVNQVSGAANGGIVVDLTVTTGMNTVTTRYGNAAVGVLGIELNGLGGDDAFTLMQTLAAPLTIDGGLGNDTILGPDDAVSWTIDGTDSGTATGELTFSGIENIVGGTSDDEFNVRDAGALSGLIDGGGGDGKDLLSGPYRANTWIIDGPDAGSLNGTTGFIGIENLTGGNNNDDFRVLPGGSLSGVLDGGFDDADAPAPAVDRLDLSALTAPVTVDLALASTATINEFSRIDNLIGSSGAGDTLFGPGSGNVHVTWHITGPDAGEVEGIAFSGFENLTGQSLGASDSFYFEALGTLSGAVDGGTGTRDSFAAFDGTDYVVFTDFNPGAVDAAGTTSGSFPKVITYRGMDDQTPIDDSDPDNTHVRGSAFSDRIVLEDDPTVAGHMRVRFLGLRFFTAGGVSGSFSFAAPADSLTIEGGTGGDTITVLSVDEAFAADLLIYGNRAGQPSLEPDVSRDEVRFEGDTYTRGGYLEVFADGITVADGVTLSTLANTVLVPDRLDPSPNPALIPDLASGNDIVFRARRIGTPEVENLLPAGFLSKSVHIDIGDSAKLYAGSIYLVAQAEDRAIADQLGLTTLQSDFFVDPAMTFLSYLTALPIKVLVKSSDAKVTIGDHARLQADNVIGVYATAAADASGGASGSQLFALGYSQAKANANIEIQDGAFINANGPINITSDGTAIASMATAIANEPEANANGKKGAAFAASVAVSWADLKVKTTVAPTATIHGGRTVNTRALGTIESVAEAESGVNADGGVAVTLAFQFSTADILTQIDGTVTADMNTPGGEVVKFEFDPTIAASDYTSAQTSIPRLKKGETVRVTAEVPQVGPSDLLMPANTVFRYKGLDIAGPVNLSTQNFRDSNRWEVTSQPWGYVDVDNDRIAVFNTDNEANNWVVVTEDTVDYSPRRGTSIGGLDAGQTYVVVALVDDPATAVDESHFIKLARGENNAIAAAAWELEDHPPGQRNPYVIDLTPGATVNQRTFGAADIHGDVIVLPAPPPGEVFNTIELGQAVIYREPGRSDADKVVDGLDGRKHWQSTNPLIDGTLYVPLIEGLEHGGLYYVMTGVDQFDLIGDSRFASEQVLQLGALENETRGGVARVKLGAVAPGATGFTLSSQQILDSTFLTFGAGSALDATDSASATAGTEREAPDPAGKPPAGFDWRKKIKDVQDVTGKSPFDHLFDKAAGYFNSNNASSGALPVQVAGAVAFSYTDHETKTLITGTADLNSNDDMELTSNITQNLKITAEATTDEDPSQKDAQGRQTHDSGSASISAAIVVGVESNQAEVIIDSGAHLDSMRALRVISNVTYPFLTRPDELVPTTRGELEDRINTEGFGAITSFLSPVGTLTGMLNTWAHANAKADKIGIAGSINVLLITNVARSIVHSGVEINQDDWYHPSDAYYTDPDHHDPTTDNDGVIDQSGVRHGSHSNNANNVDEHVVSIEATNYMQFVNMTGVFAFKPRGLPTGDDLLDAEGFADIKAEFKKNADRQQQAKGGVGGAIFVEVLDNTTHAIVEDGVQLYSGRESGLNIKAEEAIAGLGLTQGGADARKWAVAGSFSFVKQDSDILAHLDAGSVITGGRVDVYAGSLETQINWAGGVAAGKSVAAGIAVAINLTDRKTRAVIGELEDAAGTGSNGRLTIGHPDDPDTLGRESLAGAVTARSLVAGGIYAFTVAGAKVNTTPDNPTTTTDQQANTGVGIAGAASVNKITDVTQASLSDATVHADAVDVRASNRNRIVGATGGLAFAKAEAGTTGTSASSKQTAAAVAGAFSYNEIHTTTDAFIRDADMTLAGVPLDSLVVATAERRFSLTADNAGQIWTLAAGIGGALAKGNTGGATAVSLAGSVSVNTVAGHTRARMYDSALELLPGDPASVPSDALVRAGDDSEIFAIAGGLSIAIAKGGTSGGANAVSIGVAVAIDTIVTDTDALVESSELTWDAGATGRFDLEAASSGQIKAFTVAGAAAAALSQQGRGTAVAGAGSGSVNEVDADTTATLRSSIVRGPGAVNVEARNDSEIIAGAGAVAVAFASAGSSTAASVAIGASFAVNLIGRDDDENRVWAEIDDSEILVGGAITVDAEMSAGIFALGIGAAGGVSNSTSGSAIGIAGAGSVGFNKIRNNTQALVHGASSLTSGAAGVTVSAQDDSWINSTAGAAALSIAVAQSTAVAIGLGFSLTINEIRNTTRAAIEDSDVTSAGAVTVSADSHARIDSLGFGIAVGVAISESATAVSVNATGALSFNTIDNLVEATIRNSGPTGSHVVSAAGAVRVTASDDSSIQAIAIAASASISGTTSATSVGVSVGLALAHNTIDKDVAASIANVPRVLTGGGDVTVGASDEGSIQVVSVAAAVAVAIGGTGVGVAGGASESTNVILSRTNATIENSKIGSAARNVGKVDLTATSTSTIEAVVAGVAAAVGVGTSGAGAGAAIGIAVARNFIGWDPQGARDAQGDPITADYDDITFDSDGNRHATLVGTLTQGTGTTPGTRVRVADGALAGDIYEYIGPTLTDSDPDTVGNQPFDLSIQQYRDAGVWKHVNVAPNASEVQASIRNSSVHAAGDLTIAADATEVIDAVVLAAAVSVGGGTTVGVGISGAGVYSENKIQTHIKAYIDGDGSEGITARSARIVSDDSSVIDSIAGAAALSAGIGTSGAGVAVSIGLSLAFNEIRNDVGAYVKDADFGLTTSSGDVTIRAASHGQYVFDLLPGALPGSVTLAGLVSALDDAATADPDNPNNPASTTDNVDDPKDDAVDEAREDIKGDQAILAALHTAIENASHATLGTADTVAGDSLLKTDSGLVAVAEVAGSDRLMLDATVFADGDKVVYHNAGGPSIGLADGTYYVKKVADDPGTEGDESRQFIRLSLTDGGAAIATLISPLADLSVHTFRLTTNMPPAGTPDTEPSRRAVAAIVGGNQIQFTANHDFATGDYVLYDSGGGKTIGGIANGFYFVIKVSDTVIRLAKSMDDIIAGLPIAALTHPTADLSAHTVRQLWDLRDGVTVKLPDHYVNGGVGGRVYRYIGPANPGIDDRDDVNLATENYSSSDWQLIDKLEVSTVVAGHSWTVVAPNGKTFVLELDEARGRISVSRGTINALSVAASLAVGIGGGSAGVAVAGAGAVAQNVILSKTDAHAENSIIDSNRFNGSGGAVTLNAESTSGISAVVVGASVAIGGGSYAGIGVSIGVAVARNFIGWTPDGNEAEGEVQAYLKDTSVDADGALSVTAFADQRIDSLVIAGSAAVGLGALVGVAVSGSGVFAENVIGVDVGSRIDGDGAGGIQAASVTLIAGDTSSINALAGAVSLAASFGLTAGVSVAIGVSVGHNKITSTVEASIRNAEVVSTPGGITVSAREAAEIHALSFAASLAAGFAGGAGIGVSGAGAVSTNVILTKTNAFASGSDLDSAGDVSVTADMTSVIDAKVLAVSAAVGIGVGAGIGVAIGVSVARNFIGWDPAAAGVIEDRSTSSQPRFLTVGDTVRVEKGPRKGEVYEFLGDLPRFKYTDAETSAPDLNTNDVVKVEGVGTYRYLGADKPTAVSLADSVQHYATSADWLLVVRENRNRWSHTSAAGSVAVLHRDDLVKVEGAAIAAALNRDTVADVGANTLTFKKGHEFSTGTLVTYVSSDGDRGGLARDTYYRVRKIDNFTIRLETMSGGVVDLTAPAEWSDGTSALVTTTPGIYKYIGSEASGVSLADSVQRYATDRNNWQRIDSSDLSAQDFGDVQVWKQLVDSNPSQVRASLHDTSVRAAGALTIAAETSASIDALVIAASAAVGGGAAVGVAASGAGSYGANRIQTLVHASIDGDGATGISARKVSITADDSSGINAIAGGISLAGAIGIAGGAGALSVGLSLAYNEVDNDVQAFIRDADFGVRSTGTGVDDDVTIAAHTQGRPVFDTPLSLAAAGLTVAELDFAARTDASDPGRKRADAEPDAATRMAILEKLREAFLDQKQYELALYDSVATPATYQTDVKNPQGSHVQNLREGNTVELGRGYDTALGKVGRVYRHKGGDRNGVNLAAENYNDTSKWILLDKLKLATLVEGKRWELLAPDGKTFILELNSSGGLIVTAATINAVSAAGSFAMSISPKGVGVAVAGAGAVAENVVLSTTAAFGERSRIESVGDVRVSAASTAEISSIVVAAAVGVAGGGSGIGAAIGVAVANNFIGSTPDGAPALGSGVKAYLEDTSVRAGGDLALQADADETIASLVVTASLAIGAGGFGLAAAGAGISAENHIRVEVASFIDGDGATGIVADRIRLTAHDTSTINALAAGVAVAAAFGPGAVAVAVGVTLAHNSIANVVEASIANADTRVESEVGDIRVEATESSSIRAVAVAAAAAIAGGYGVGAAGAGVESVNAIANSVDASISGSTNVRSHGLVTVAADDTAKLSATIVSVALSGGMVGISVGVLLADNTIDDVVSAFIGGSSVTANGGNIEVTATSTPSITTESVAAAVSVAIGASVSGAVSSLRIGTTTEAYVVDSTLTAIHDEIQVHATSTSRATPKVTSASVSGGIAIAILESESIIAGVTRAYAGGQITVAASKLDIHATDRNTSISEAIIIAGGAIAGAGANSTSRITRATEAYIADGARVMAASTPIVLNADTPTNEAEGRVVQAAVAAVAISFLTDTVEAGGTTSAFVGGATTVIAGSLTTAATASNAARAHVDLVTVGLITVGGVHEVARTTAVASAYLAPTGSVLLRQNGTSDGPASFTATMLTNEATADSLGISVGLGVSVLLVDVLADAGGTAQAYVAGRLTASTLDLTATSINTAKSKTTAVSVGTVAVAVSTTAATISQTTDARLKSGADVTLSGAATFFADSTATPTAHTTGVNVGAVSGAEQHVTTTLGGTTRAGSESGAGLRGTSLRATAISRNSGAGHDDVSASFVDVSLLGGSGATLASSVTQSTDASLGGVITLSGGAVLDARSDTYSTARNSNVAVSGLSITLLDVNASLAGSTTAGVADGGRVTASSLTGTATGNATAIAETRFVGFSIAGGQGSRTISSLNQTVAARVGKNAVVNLDTGAASLTASGTGASTASNSAVSVSGIGVSTMSISASTGGGVHAFVDDGGSIHAGSVVLSATGTQTPTASNSYVDVSGFNIGLTTVAASDATVVSAYVGSQGGGAGPTMVETTGAAGLTVAATAISTPRATANFVGVGILANGTRTTTTATGTPTAQVYVGSNASVDTNAYDASFTAVAKAGAKSAGSGVGVSLLVAAGTAESTATLNPIVGAFTVGGGSLSGRHVSFTSRLNRAADGSTELPSGFDEPAFATAQLAGGALLAGVAGANVTANNLATVTTEVGAGKTVSIDGDLLVKSLVHQRAVADGFTLGIGLGAGVGVVNPTASVGGSVVTRFDGTVQNARNVTVSGNVDASTKADGRASAGALLLGLNIVTVTTTTSPNVATSVAGAITASGDIVVESVVATKSEGFAKGFSLGAVGIGQITVNSKADAIVGTTVAGTGRLTSTLGAIRIGSYHNYAGGNFVAANQVAARSESLTAGFLFQTNSALVNADAQSDVTTITAAGSTLDAAGRKVTVEARSGNFAVADVQTAGGALISVTANNDPFAQARGTTTARLEGNVRHEVGGVTTAGADALEVIAEGTDLATAALDSSSGGVITVAVSNSRAESKGNVTAQLGAGTSEIIATTTALVRAEGTTDADASTRSSGGGLVSVSNFNATVDTNPTIAVSVGDRARITAETITVDARHDIASIEYSDGTFNGQTSVDTADSPGGNRITFTLPHGLSSGQLITYRTNGTATIGGLTDGRSYGVVVPAAGLGSDPSRSLQFGNAFDGAIVDGATDEFRFRGSHGFVSGDRVLYFNAPGSPVIGGLTPGQAYVVNVIDSKTIKLRLPGAAAPAVTVAGSAVGTDVVNVANAFVEGSPITYRDPVGQTFNSGSVELRSTGTDSGRPLVDTNTNRAQYDSDGNWIFLGSNPNNQGEFQTGHGFNTGDAVYYTRTGGNGSTLGPTILPNTVYYVIRVDAFRFKLADSLAHATGVSAGPGGSPPAIPQTALELTPDRSPDGVKVTHRIYRNNDAPLAGLEDGQVYYAKNRTASSFQLADASGAIVSFNNGGRTGGSHHFEFEGLNLSSTGPAPDGKNLHTLIFDLTSAGANATQQLVGVGGLGTSAGAPSGDQIPTASASGSSGGFIDVAVAKATATARPVVTNTIYGSAVLSAGTINVTTDNRANVGATTAGGGGGFVSVGDSDAVANATSVTTITIETGAELLARDNINVADQASFDTTVSAASSRGGLVGIVHTSANTTITHNTLTIIKGILTAGGAIVVGARTAIEGDAGSESRGGGLGVNAEATARVNVSGDSVTQSQIWGTARLTAEHIQVNATIDRVRLNAKAESVAEAFAADASALAEVNLRGSVEVQLLKLVGTGEQLVGNRSILLESLVHNVDLSADSGAHAYVFAGATHTDANAGFETVAKVTGQNDSVIKTADLTVNTIQTIDTYNRSRDDGGGFIVGRYGGAGGNFDPKRQIYWETTTIMLGESNPELIVDATGKVVQLVNVQLAGGYGLGHVYNPGDDIVVLDIDNTGSANARFHANELSFGGSSASEGQIWGNAGLFQFQHTWDDVRLTNYSDRNLVVNRIDVAGGDNVRIDIDVRNVPGPVDLPGDTRANRVSLSQFSAPGMTFEFDIEHTFPATQIEIQNLHPPAAGAAPRIVLDGDIHNPIGRTFVHNVWGDIRAGADAAIEIIRTNVLELDANLGSIGEQGTRRALWAELVEFKDVAGTLHTGHVTVEAGKDVVLDLTYVRRSSATLGAPLTVTIDSLRAGDDVDVVVNDSKEGSDLGSIGSVVVADLGSTPEIRSYANHFRYDEIVNGLDDILRAFGTATRELDSSYLFREVRAGDDIDISHVSTTPADGEPKTSAITALIAGVVVADPVSDTRVDFELLTDVAALLFDLDTGLSVAAPPDTVPMVVLTTNGNIKVTEQKGDLLIGHIHSTTGDVELVAAGRILDADSLPSIDVTGANITMTSGAVTPDTPAPSLGGIGRSTDFLEVNVDRNGSGGVLEAFDIAAPSHGGIYLSELLGDMRVDTVNALADVALNTVLGSIVDARNAGAGGASAGVLGQSIDIDAVGGSIGAVGNDLEIDSGRGAPTADVGLEAASVIYLTEVVGTLRLVQARTPGDPATTGGGDIHLTVRESTVADSLDENLDLLASGAVLFVENAPRTVANGFIRAGGRIELRIGDDLTRPRQHHDRRERPDRHLPRRPEQWHANGDFGYGAKTTLVGTLTPGAGKVASIFGFTDADRITLDQTTLGGSTRVYGSNLKTPDGGTAPLGDGEDVFTVNQLPSMPVGTLTLDGQAGSDHYIVNTSGSQNADRNYVINVLDTGAAADGVDVLSIYGFDSAQNGNDPATSYPTDDIFLLRGMTGIAGETSHRAAFVALLHGTVAQAQAGASTAVERINYDSAINGRLEVFGQGGNDSFATDDNSAITTLDGGAGDDSFQIGQLYGTRRDAAAHLAAPDDRSRSPPSRRRAAGCRRGLPRRSWPRAATGTTCSASTRTRRRCGSKATTATTSSWSARSRSLRPRRQPTAR